MKKCILYERLQNQLWNEIFFTFVHYIKFDSDCISISRLINQNIIFQVCHFLFYCHKFIRITYRIAKQGNKGIDDCGRFFHIPLPCQPLYTCQCIIHIMWINLHLQCVNFRVSFFFLNFHAFFYILIDSLQHRIISFRKFLNFFCSFPSVISVIWIFTLVVI